MDRIKLVARILLEARERLKKEDFRINLGEFRSRLILQKFVYLMQEFGFDLGYPFGWYIRGPYSPSLADDAFRHLEVFYPWYENVIRELGLPLKKEDIGKFLNFLREMLAIGLPVDMILEFAASVVYLVREEGMSADEAIETLRLRKFSLMNKIRKEDIDYIINVLRRYDLI